MFIVGKPQNTNKLKTFFKITQDRSFYPKIIIINILVNPIQIFFLCTEIPINP